jgi:hypothetical protein
MSDAWCAYINIDSVENGSYNHDVVVHENEFVRDDDSDIHTQSAESFCNKAKRKWKHQCGTSAVLFPSYVDDIVCSNYCSGNVLRLSI